MKKIFLIVLLVIVLSGCDVESWNPDNQPKTTEDIHNYILQRTVFTDKPLIEDCYNKGGEPLVYSDWMSQYHFGSCQTLKNNCE